MGDASAVYSAMDAKTVGLAARAGGTESAFRLEHGLNWEGSHYAGSGGHPNSWVAGSRMLKLCDGGVSYDKDPLKDRLTRIGRFDGVTAIVGQMRSHPMNERVQRMGCISLAEISFHNWDYTVKAAIARGAAAVVSAMQNHPSSEGLQHWGCAAPACMSQGSEHGRRICVHEGGATAVGAALSKFPSNEAINGWGGEMLQSAQHDADGSAWHPLEGPGRKFGGVLAEARERQAAQRALGC